MLGEVLDDGIAVALVEQVGEVHVEAVLLPPLTEFFCALADAGARVRVVFGGQPAARRGQLRDVVEEPVLRLGRQVYE